MTASPRVLLARLPIPRPVQGQQEIPIHQGMVPWVAGIGALLILCGITLWLSLGYHAGFYTLNDVGKAVSPELWASLTLLGDTRIALALLLLLVYRSPQLLPATLIASIPVTLCVHLCKNLASLPRPASVLDPGTFQIIGEVLRKGSFPSGHSATIGVIAALLLLISQRTSVRIAVITVMSAVAMSRVMVGAHWPVDALVGAGLGMLSGLAGYQLARRYRLMQHIASQWSLVALLLVAAVTTFFVESGYPQGQYFAMCVAAAGLVRYHYQLLSNRLQSDSL